jgi:hypothetical protein
LRHKSDASSALFTVLPPSIDLSVGLRSIKPGNVFTSQWQPAKLLGCESSFLRSHTLVCSLTHPRHPGDFHPLAGVKFSSKSHFGRSSEWAAFFIDALNFSLYKQYIIPAIRNCIELTLRMFMKIGLVFLFLCSMLGAMAKDVLPELVSLKLQNGRLSGINLESLWGVETKTTLIDGDTLEIVFAPVYRGGTPIDIVIPPEAKKIKIFGVDFDLPQAPGDTRIQSYLLENIVTPLYSFDRSESLRLISMITVYPQEKSGRRFDAQNNYVGQSGKEQWFMSMRCSGIITPDGGVFGKYGSRGPEKSGYYQSIDFFNDDGKLGIYMRERLRHHKKLVEKRVPTAFDIPKPDVQLLTLVKLNQPYVENFLKRLEKAPPIDSHHILKTPAEYREFLKKLEHLKRGMSIKQVYSAVFDDPSSGFVGGNTLSYPLVQKCKDWRNEDTDVWISFEFVPGEDGDMGLSAIY